jgi:meiotic recombination protein SPO11
MSKRSLSSLVENDGGGKVKSKGKRPDVNTDSVDKVLEKVRQVKSTLRAKIKSDATSGNTDLDLQQQGITEAEELVPAEVSKRIEDLVVDVVHQILNANSFELSIPNRGSGNQMYLEQLDRIVLGDKVSKRQFLNTAHVRKTAITTRVMELVHEVLSKGIHITKRDLFYTDVKLFKDQSESDAVLDDVACMVGCTRTSLHIVASDKGLVVGRIQYREAGDLIDCTKMGVGGKAIPPYIDRITDIQSDAEFIILVEKEAVYLRMAEDRFYDKYPCIVITGKGQPDVATRLFLRKVRDQLQIPVLALVDSDPYGLKILSVYCSGSKQMSYDSNHLTTTDIKWLGVSKYFL